MSLLKKQELYYDNIISKGKAENHRKFTPLIFDLNKKKTTNFFLLHIVFKWFLYLGKKNIKPITTLRRLVQNRGSLSNMNLKYHVSIPKQGLNSNSIMCLVMKPLAFPLVELFLSYVVY